MEILIKPNKRFLKDYPEYKNDKILFLGWSKKINKEWGSLQIRVKIGKRRIEFVEVGHFEDLNIIDNSLKAD